MAVKNGNDPGTYALVLECSQRQIVQIGRWRAIETAPGYYVYVGSAFGPGGVRARVARHFRTAKSNHWHIDYLRARLTPLGAWVSHAPVRLEHRWAGRLEAAEGFTPLPGFGCSDCRCNAHLFQTHTEQGLERLLGDEQTELVWWPFTGESIPPSADPSPNSPHPPPASSR